MNKVILTGIIFLIPLKVLSEANIETEDNTKTFLLNAPGTLSGKIFRQQPDAEKNKSRPSSTMQEPLKFKPGRYPKGGESFKFPQYGQVYGRYNPWSEEASNRRLPPPLPPASADYANPWDLSGRLGLPNRGYQPNPYSYNPAPGYGNYPYGYTQNLNPGFPGGIYRDTNPANSLPIFNGLMPGMGGQNSGLPFSPFGMF